MSRDAATTFRIVRYKSDGSIEIAVPDLSKSLHLTGEFANMSAVNNPASIRIIISSLTGNNFYAKLGTGNGNLSFKLDQNIPDQNGHYRVCFSYDQKHFHFERLG